MTDDSSSISLTFVYRFLAQSMNYPSTEWFNDDYWAILSTLLNELGWIEEADELKLAKSDSDDFLEDIQVEHTRLFINSIPHVIAPPYASLYYKGDGTFYGAIAEKTKEFYRSKGFELKQDGDLPDHIIHELEFLALLATEDPAGENEFLEKFFVPWFSIFKNKVIEEAHHPFYRVVIKLIDFFTREEL